MSEIHDNIIKSYTVDLENSKISFNTVYYYNDITEETSIEFYNVMGHVFSNVIKGSILFDINNYSIDDFIKDNKEKLAKGRNYGWPFHYENDDDLIRILNMNSQKYYVIRTSYGLDGWILAEEMKVIIRRL